MSAAQLLARFQDLADELHAFDLTALTSGELVDFLRDFETQKRR